MISSEDYTTRIMAHRILWHDIAIAIEELEQPSDLAPCDIYYAMKHMIYDKICARYNMRRVTAGWAMMYCFLCDITELQSGKCLIDCANNCPAMVLTRGNKNRCLGGLWDHFCDAVKAANYQKAARIARQISNMPLPIYSVYKEKAGEKNNDVQSCKTAHRSEAR